jgi:hypothetical protein
MIRLVYKMDNLVSKLKFFGKERENKNSLSSLSKVKLTQSQSIKLGNRMEILLNNYIDSTEKYVNGFEKNKKGVKQKDLFLIDHPNKTLYYAEFKANIELDTEKAPETIKKIGEIIQNDLIKRNKEAYKDWTIKTYLVSLRFLSKSQISSTLKDKYYKTMTDLETEWIKNKYKWSINLVGIKDLFDEIKVECPKSDPDENKKIIDYFKDECNYKILINNIVTHCLRCK